MSIGKDELDQLKVKIKEVTGTASELDDKQKQIIQTAQSINMTLKNSMEAELSGKIFYDESQEKLKQLHNQFNYSTKTIELMKEKIKKIEERLKPPLQS